MHAVAQVQGGVQCWGSDDNGQLGNDAPLTNQTKAVAVSAGTYSKVELGYQQTCGIRSDAGNEGRMSCWGRGDGGQLGGGNWSNSGVPVLAASTKQFSSLSLGADHTCAIEATTAYVYCWGENEKGQLGTGNTAATNTVPTGAPSRTTRYTALAASVYATCAITEAGPTECWGSNAQGQLGADYPNDHLTPVTVSGNKTFSALTAWSLDSAFCGTEASTSNLFCWGSGIAGRFGSRTEPLHQYPSAPVQSGTNFTQISQSLVNACGVTSTGATYCWGANWGGNLGTGDWQYRAVPSLITGVSLSQVATSYDFACGIGFADGTGYCWGDDTNGRLGNGATTGYQLTPVQTSPTSLKFSKIVVGTTHACAIGLSDKQIYCWGDDGAGQLGNAAASTNLDAPTSVSASLKFRDVAAGSNFTCGVVDPTSSTDPNKLYCWGTDGSGQLGNGATTGVQQVPQLIDSGTNYKAVMTGSLHACAITSSDQLRCWGAGSATGTNSASNRTSPTTVSSNGSGTDTYATVAGSDASTCAVTTTGAAYCWGNRAHAQGGLAPDTSDALTPVAVPGNLTWTTLFSGSDSNTFCGHVSGNPTPRCWGEDAYNQTDTYANAQLTSPTEMYFGSGDITNLAQHANVSTPALSTGATLGTSSFVAKATVNSAYANDALRLCVEYKPVGNAFTGTENDVQCGDAIAPGGTASVQVTGLVASTGYHWRAQVYGSISGHSAFTSYGANNESTADFTTAGALTASLAGYTQIAIGTQIGCGIDMMGVAYCWGLESTGLGDGTFAEAPRPKPISTTLRFVDIAAGIEHACAIAIDSSTWCWGLGNNGELGNGATVNSAMPVQVKLANDTNASFVQITTTADSTCGRTAAGTIHCWGYNDHGQLGNSNTINQSKAVQAGTNTYSTISAGFAHVCGIRTDTTPKHQLACWGAGWSGQLGVSGFYGDQTSPTLVTGARTFSSIAAGIDHTCAIGLENSQLYCWGANDRGQLGDGTTVEITAPPTSSARSTTYSRVAASYSATCATTTSGVTECWGSNENGELGADYPNTHLTPIATVGGKTFDVLLDSNADAFFCGVERTTHNVFCWGDATMARFGNIPHPLHQYPPAEMNAGITFAQVANGKGHSCGVTATNTAYCWGENWSGSLGVGDDRRRGMPTQIPTYSFSQIAAGDSITCALTTDGTPYCWGNNATGQLGTGNTNSQSVPTALNTSAKFSKIVVGTSHACAITLSTELLYCWGSDGSGQVGDGGSNSTSVNSPTAIGSAKYQDVAVGEDFTCAVTATDDANPSKLFCWGNKTDGRVGDNTDSGTQGTPLGIDTGTTYAEVSLGGTSACARTLGNQVTCWGAGGRTGNGGWTDVLVPTVIGVNGSGTDTYTSLSSNYDGHCATTTNSALVCWGKQAHAQTGITVSDNFALSPVVTSSDHMWTALFDSTAPNTGCGTTTDGGTKTRCWGENSFNQANTYHNPVLTNPEEVYFLSGTPSALSQYRSDGTSSLSIGTTTRDNTSVMKATVASQSATDRLRLCVEVQPVGTAFTHTDADTKCGTNAVTTGNTATITIDGLQKGVSYHWQARTHGTESGFGPATSFGGNAETVADFITQVEPNATTLGFAQLAMARDTTCGINHEGKVYCWGDGSTGSIGDSADDSNWRRFSRSNPTAVASALTYSKITAGTDHFCALSGTDVYCWGASTWGQLGTGSTAPHSKPTKINSATAFVDVAAGDYFTCARSTQGYVWCWGSGDQYRLGNNSYSVSTSPVQPSGVTSIVFSALAVGENSACALRATDNVLMCWGANTYGQVGNGTTTDQSVPTAISGTWRSVTIGGQFACAAAYTSNAVSCWGRNDYGQLGDGTTASRPSALPVSGSFGASSLVAGNNFVCGISDARTVSCWGRNEHGQLGDGTTTDRTTPTAVTSGVSMRQLFSGPLSKSICGLKYGTDIPMCWGRTTPGVLNEASYSVVAAAPVSVNHAQTYTQVVMGERHACGLTAAGEVYCWGSNGLGAAGGAADFGAPTKISGTMVFTQLTAGALHTCGITSSPTANAAYCWGDNLAGQLGDSTGVNKSVPTRVANGASSGLFSSISAGAQHTCAIQSGTNKYVYCWGENWTGQLGTNNTTDSMTPVRVNNTLNYDEVALGEDFSCARRGITIDCWGANDNYQLGKGDTTTRLSPTSVTGSYSTVSVGGYHVCAIASADSTLRCWGPDWGQLALDNGYNGQTPSPAAGGATFVQITAGRIHTCGRLLSAAQVWCAGNNTHGQLGIGSINETSPVSSAMSQVTGSVSWASGNALSTGAFAWTQCGNNASNALYCWGRNTHGQFGNLSYAYQSTPVGMRFLSAHNTAVDQYENTDVIMTLGEGTAQTTVKFKATVSDLEPTDTAKLCVEAKPIGTAFDDTNVLCSSAAANGVVVTATVTGLTANTDYHWRWRMESTLYGKKLWQLYGDNLESVADFGVDTVVPTVASLVQFRSDGTTSITNGEWRNDANIKLGATATDTRLTTKICVRYAQKDTSSFSTPACSALGASGAPQLVAVAPADGEWYWQAQAVDSAGNASAWTDYNSDGMSARDVGIDITAPSVSSPEQYRSDGTTAISAAGFTNEASVKLNGTVSDATSSVQLCVRAVVHVDRGQLGTQTCSTLGATGTQYTHVINSLTANTEYDWEYWAVDQAGNASSHTWYNGAGPSFTTDTLAPSTGTVYDGVNAPVQESFNNGSLDTLSGSWTDFATTGAIVVRYEYAIGMSAGGTQLVGWTNTDWINAGSPKVITKNGLGLHTGQLYYVSLRAVDAAGNTSSAVSSPGQMVAPTLTFTASTTSVDLGSLNASNSYTANGSVTLTTSTNAYNGYVLSLEASEPVSNGAQSIPQSVGGTWAAPTATPGVGLAYSSSGTGGYADTKFADGGFWAETPIGTAEIFANHPNAVTGTPITDEAFMLLLRMKANSTQAAGSYHTTLRVSNVASY